MHMVHVYWIKKKKVRKSPNNIVTSLVIYCFKPLKIRSSIHTIYNYDNISIIIHSCVYTILNYSYKKSAFMKEK